MNVDVFLVNVDGFIINFIDTYVLFTSMILIFCFLNLSCIGWLRLLLLNWFNFDFVWIYLIVFYLSGI